MNSKPRLERLFDRKAQSFDAIYNDREVSARSLWNHLTRKNVGDRAMHAIEALGDVRGKRLLDAGCGPGRQMIELARRGAAEVVGVDLSTVMVAMASDKANRAGVADRCRCVQADLLQWETEQLFNGVLALGLFDYATEPLLLLTRLAQSCDGSLLASFPARWTLRAPVRKAFFMLRRLPLRLYSKVEVRRLCADAGLVACDLITLGPIYLLHARRTTCES